MRVRPAVGVAVLVAAMLVAAQLLLPLIAERHVRGELERTGGVRSVSVSAFPAVQLLWGHADAVRVHLARASLGTGSDLADRLAGTRGVDSLDAAADDLALGPLDLRDLRLDKRGRRLHGEAVVTRAALAAALPVDVDLQPADAGGAALTLQATVGPVSVRARLSAIDGRLVIAPDGLLGGFAGLTVFEDPRITVTGVGARERPDGFTLTADGRLR